MATPIFQCSGRYSGFLSSGDLSSARGKYLGWTEQDGSVWGANGQLVGHLTDENYILRSYSTIPPIPRLPRIPPIPPIPPIPQINRIGRIPRIGWQDPLEPLSST